MRRVNMSVEQRYSAGATRVAIGDGGACFPPLYKQRWTAQHSKPEKRLAALAVAARRSRHAALMAANGFSAEEIARDAGVKIETAIRYVAAAKASAP